jgi:hypothetical protein
MGFPAPTSGGDIELRRSQQMRSLRVSRSSSALILPLIALIIAVGGTILIGLTSPALASADGMAPGPGEKVQGGEVTFSWALPSSGRSVQFLAIANNDYFDGCLDGGSGPAEGSSPGKAQYIPLAPDQTSATVNLSPFKAYYWTVELDEGFIQPDPCMQMNDTTLSIVGIQTYGRVTTPIATRLFNGIVASRTLLGSSDLHTRCHASRGGWKCTLSQPNDGLAPANVLSGIVRTAGTRVTWNISGTFEALEVEGANPIFVPMHVATRGLADQDFFLISQPGGI